MTRYLFIFSIFLFACKYMAPEAEIHLPSPDELHLMAEEESLQPIHPGIPGIRPFWNTFAQRFIYAPAFEFDKVEGADRYQFIARADSSGLEYTFISDKPWDPISPIWNKLPISRISLTVLARKGEEILDTAGVRVFHKASQYLGPYRQPEVDYQTSMHQLVNYLYNAPYFQYWLDQGTPDPDYGLYGYPSKMFAAVIQGMLLYEKFENEKEKKENAIKIARITADYLIGVSQPEGSPMEYFPPTYTGPIYADMVDEYRGESLADRIMLIYPATVGEAYLDLYDFTRADRYLEAAVRIADTYKQLQLDNGSWYLLIYIGTGESVASNYVVPTGIISFLDRLKEIHGIKNYEPCRDRALAFIRENLVRDFNWEGQFEDQKPSERYQNLSKGQACSYAGFLFKEESGDPEKLELAEELIRFAEDQFVIWDHRNDIDSWGITSDKWLTPCVLEQFNFYTPVNASSGNMIEVFMQAYDRTGKILYLAKAMDLANTIVDTQNSQTGHYPTYLVSDLLDQEGWINCMVYTANVIDELDRFLKERSIVWKELGER
jgi:maltose/maltodextrin transport system substrate-binding protein